VTADDRWTGRLPAVEPAAAGADARTRVSIVEAIRSASLPTPWIIVDENAYRKCRPTK
jgi:hypothetical protein